MHNYNSQAVIDLLTNNDCSRGRCEKADIQTQQSLYYFQYHPRNQHFFSCLSSNQVIDDSNDKLYQMNLDMFNNKNIDYPPPLPPHMK